MPKQFDQIEISTVQAFKKQQNHCFPWWNYLVFVC